MFWIKQYILAILIGIILILASALSAILVAASVNISEPVAEINPRQIKVENIQVYVKPQVNKNVKSIKNKSRQKENKSLLNQVE